MTNKHNIETVFATGCSHSAGGGLETIKYADDKVTLVRDIYKEKYNVWWDNQLEVTYASRLADMLGCGVENKAASGGGTGRAVREAFDFVKRNWDKKDKLLLLLELPAYFHRLDMYSTNLNSWVVVNHSVNEDGVRDYVNATRGYYMDGHHGDFENTNKDGALEKYLDNFIDYDIEVAKMNREAEMLLTFLKYHKIKFIYFEGGQKLKGVLDKSLLSNELNIEGHTDFHHWIMKNGYTIKDELGADILNDLHPGYFGNIKFAEFLYQYINTHYDIL